MKRDEKRDQYLKSLGLVVLRFDNLQVLKEIDAVLEVIFLEVEKFLKSPRLDLLAPILSAPFAKGAGSSVNTLLPN